MVPKNGAVQAKHQRRGYSSFAKVAFFSGHLSFAARWVGLGISLVKGQPVLGASSVL